MKRAVWIRDFVERVERAGTGSHNWVRLKERIRSSSARDIRKLIRQGGCKLAPRVGSDGWGNAAHQLVYPFCEDDTGRMPVQRHQSVLGVGGVGINWVSESVRVGETRFQQLEERVDGWRREGKWSLGVGAYGWFFGRLGYEIYETSLRTAARELRAVVEFSGGNELEQSSPMMMVVNIVVVIVNDVVLNYEPKYDLRGAILFFLGLILKYVNLPNEVQTESFFRERKLQLIRSQT